MTSPGVAPCGHGTPSACADSRSRSTSRGSASGSVRTIPTPPSSISRAAHMPVSSEICAFHSSTGSVARLPSVHTPSAPCSTTCSGVGRVIPPRARSAASRRMPTSRSSGSDPSAVPSSRAAWAPVYVSCARLRTSARRTSMSTGSPSASRSIVHSSAGVTWSGSRLATPSDSSGGCSGVRPSGAYRVSTRSRASSSIAPPGDTHAATSAIAYRTRNPSPRRSMWTAWSRSLDPSGSMVTNGMSVASACSPVGRARCRGLGDHLRRELLRHAELDAQVVEAAPHEHVDRLPLRLLRRAGVQLDMASGHAASLGGRRPSTPAGPAAAPTSPT